MVGCTNSKFVERALIPSSRIKLNLANLEAFENFTSKIVVNNDSGGKVSVVATMYFSNKIVLLLFVSLTLGLSITHSQNMRDKSSKTKANANRGGTNTTANVSQYREQALSVVTQLFDEAKKIDNPQQRIETQSQVAHVLWDYDKERATQYFREVFLAVDDVKFPKLPNKPSPPSASKGVSPKQQLRGEIIRLVALHDVNLAEELIRSIPKDVSYSESGSETQDEQNNQSELYLRVALSLADTDPTRSAQLAKISLSGGVNSSLLRVLSALRQKDPTIADDVYDAALNTARTDKKNTSTNIPMLATYAIPDFGSNIFNQTSSQTNTVTTGVGDKALASFLNFAFDAISRRGTAVRGEQSASGFNSFDYTIGQRLLPYFDRYLPAKSAEFRSLLSQLAGSNDSKKEPDLLTKSSQASTIEEVLKQAEDAKLPMQRDFLYFRAVLLMSGEGDFSRALTIVGKISDEGFKTGLDTVVRVQAVAALLGKNDYDAAYGYAKEVLDVKQRAALLGKVARKLYDKGDSIRSAQILNDAEKLIASAEEGAGKAHAMLILTDIKTRINPMQGFEGMVSTVAEFNRADTKESRKTPSIADVNSMLSNMITKVFKLETPDFNESFPLLARTDFNRALQLAQAFEMKDRAITAQIAVCRGVLVESKEVKKRPNSTVKRPAAN